MIENIYIKKKSPIMNLLFNYYIIYLFILVRKRLSESNLIGLGKTYHYIDNEG